MIYRRRVNTYIWHFFPECSKWPTDDFEERADRPANDPLDLCSECTALMLRIGRRTPKAEDEG